MLTHIADAFGCFVLASAVLAVISFNAAVVCDDPAPVAVIAYITAAGLVGWFGSYKFYLKYSLPIWAMLMGGAYYFDLIYTVMAMLFIVIVSILIMHLTRVISPVVKDL